MAGASDKARFYLEQSVPELREWERREIFTKEEISAIAAKRSDFEHVLSARGSSSSDYVRYAEYEMNLDALRRKRVKRKGIKATTHSGQRRVFLILNRATKKFHGDLGLWMQYIEYARKQRANKKLKMVLTEALRMHPTKTELWIYASRYAMDVQADIGNARTYMQRGLRFCKESKIMYLEYARLEMAYVAKIGARRKILGIDGSQSKATAPKDDDDAPEQIDEADIILFPTLTANDLKDETTANSALRDTNMADLPQTPAMTGAIPMAIFDAAMQAFDNDVALCTSFFDLFSEYTGTPCSRGLLQTVVDRLVKAHPSAVETISCQCRQVIVGIPMDSPDFPSALGRMAKDVRTAISSAPLATKATFSEKFLSWLRPLGDSEDLAPELKQVLFATMKRLSRELPQI